MPHSPSREKPFNPTRLSPARLATSLFTATFATRPTVAASAPGRVNLIGEHTDYNGGPVLPVALEQRTAVAARAAQRWAFVSGTEDQVHQIQIDAPRRGGWTDYIVGVVRELRSLGAAPPGAELAVATSLPLGAGLSSSAALTVATATVRAAEDESPAPMGRLVANASSAPGGAACSRPSSRTTPTT